MLRRALCALLPLALALAFGAVACSSRDARQPESAPAARTAPPAQTAPATAASLPSVTIMTFNVENLFDTQDDPGKDDKTFLPLKLKQTQAHKDSCAEIQNDFWREQCLHWDWSEAILDRKMKVIADAILQIDNGRGPDVLAMQEVENLNVLEMLRTKYLQAAGYRPAILIEGRDERGIDVAFLTRLEVVGEPKLHDIPFEGFEDRRVADTRGILEATFRLPGGALLTGYAVHFPAPFHPTEMRVAAYEFLAKLRSALPPDRASFAAGDFNTTSAEDRAKSMLARFARPHWTVVHETGSPGRGTSYYDRDGTWSFLDMILWSPARGQAPGSGWAPRTSSVRIANNTPAQKQADGTPARFELPSGSGVSDHWPLAFDIESK